MMNAEGYRAYKTTSLFVKHVERPLILDLIGNVKGLNVVDFGCGWGYYLKDLEVMHPSRLIGIDASPSMLEMARNYINNPTETQLVWGSTSYLHIYEDEIDLLLVNFLLPYASSVRELQEICSLVYTTLRPGGRMLGFIPNPNPNLDFLSIRKFGFSCNIPPQVREGDRCKVNFYNNQDKLVLSSPFHYYSIPTVESALHSAGFDQVDFVHPKVDKVGIQAYGSEFWDPLINPPKILVFEAQKPI